MTNYIMHEYYLKLSQDMITLAKRCENIGEKIEAKAYYLKAKEYSDLADIYMPIEKLVDEKYEEKKETLYDNFNFNEHEL